ncbi:MAG: DUF512 domain-containing protein [Clostridia bacterium]|nr:DUF512 domain-containing protein [Clostridia bacterium]
MHSVNRTIGYVEPESLASEAGIVAGDIILSINGEAPLDILEYRYLIAEYEVELEIKKKNGDIEIITIENDYEDLGIEFEEGLIDCAQSCHNKCIFCFIDQLPKGMRDTVYFKDDDARLSFLQGNYVTLTNMTDDDIDRLIRMRVSPINISVHTTNPELRAKMLNNRFAGNVFERMKKFAEAGLYMNCQIVLCPNFNDKTELDRTIEDLASLLPYTVSLSVVPVGLTRYRDGLCKIEPFDKESSLAVVKQVEAHQERIYKKHGTRFVYLADEFYLNAGLDVPKSDTYEGFPQIENGVGLIASMLEEFDDAIERLPKTLPKRKVAIATGELASAFIQNLADRIADKTDISVTVFPVRNEFFGGGVDVAGLVVANDIINTVGDLSGFDELLIPDSMLRDGEDIFLDNITLDEISAKLNIKITPVPNDGYIFCESIIGAELEF